MQLEYFITGNSNKETLLFVQGADANANQFQKQHEYFSESQETRETLFSMFQLASEAIPHIRYHLARYNYLKQVEELGNPCFLIECDRDKEINRLLASTEKTMALNGTAKVKYLNGVGHMANLDETDAFNALLMEIMKEVIKYRSNE
jgi:pimeloyl-ACP methyl ester carboxylesterase